MIDFFSACFFYRVDSNGYMSAICVPCGLLLHRKSFPHRLCTVAKTGRCKATEKHCARNEIARKYLKYMKYFEDLKTRVC